jgi:hypothetical protein
LNGAVREFRMQPTASALLLLLLSLSASPQEKEQWQRIYTYNESSVDADAAKVVFGSGFTGRVKFRFLYRKPQILSDGKGIIYKAVIQTMELRCDETAYRVISIERLDNKGRRVDIEENGSAEWREAKRGSMMERLIRPGCELIYEKRRNP